ncbi:MAG: hypothetical protein DI586_06885 [Micavibrio aeruginosavorus]|uniref:Uncharacterized protein n=1 Tax=Micavibrio aeruginosavorus TaxID=349221 RepID=A0A2W5FHG4_9BACT|nr:MAG: hypothetical protein DI586_06885 [Micavibrio aeruginosavorus]
MKQKAQWEAQRENYVTQSIIVAPSSIFTNTCYKKQLGVTMDKLGLEETSGNSSSKKKFEDDVAENSTISNEFEDPESDGQKSTSKPTSSSDFECDAMSKLWEQSACANFKHGNLPSLAETGATGTDSDSRKYIDADGKEQACTTGKDDTSAGSSPFKFDQFKEDVYGTDDNPGTNLAGYTKPDPELCKRLPFSELGNLTDSKGNKLCTQQPGQQDLCAVGKSTGTPWPGDTSINGIYCTNKGCSAQLVSGKLICKKTP